MSPPLVQSLRPDTDIEHAPLLLRHSASDTDVPRGPGMYQRTDRSMHDGGIWPPASTSSLVGPDPDSSLKAALHPSGESSETNTNTASASMNPSTTAKGNGSAGSYIAAISTDSCVVNMAALEVESARAPPAAALQHHRRSARIALPTNSLDYMPHEDSVRNRVRAVIDTAIFSEDTGPTTLREATEEVVGRQAKDIFGAVAQGFDATLRSLHTWIMLCLGIFSIYVCQASGLVFPVEWSILSLGTVFPISFSLAQSYSRRDTAASYVTALRVSCMNFYMMFHSYQSPSNLLKQGSVNLSTLAQASSLPMPSPGRATGSTAPVATFTAAQMVTELHHRADVERILVEVSNTVRVYLMQKDPENRDEASRVRGLVRHVQRCLKTLYYCSDITFMGRDGPNHFRAVSILADITRAFDDLCRLRQYKPPLALRYAASLFVHMAPFLLAPSFANQQCGAKFVAHWGPNASCPAGYVGMSILVVVLLTLFKVERDLSNPFVQETLDDLHFDLGADLADFYALEVFPMETETGEITIDLAQEGELPKMKGKRVGEHQLRQALYEESRRAATAVSKLARDSVTALESAVPSPMLGMSFSRKSNNGLAGTGWKAASGKGQSQKTPATVRGHKKHQSWGGELLSHIDTTILEAELQVSKPNSPSKTPKTPQGQKGTPLNLGQGQSQAPGQAGPSLQDNIFKEPRPSKPFPDLPNI